MSYQKNMALSNKELLDLLKEHGVILTSIAIVPQHAVELVEKILGRRAAPAAKGQQDLLLKPSKLQLLLKLTTSERS